MPITFPSSPSNGQTYTVGARTWTWSGSVWELNANTIATASVGTGQIADNAVTTAKIAAGAVGESDIADGAITTAKIAAGAVVEADIASNAVTAGKLGTDVQLGYRNVIINGAMQVAQRGTSTASITGGGYYTADRWGTSITTLGTWTQTQENDAPTGSGFRKSFKILCTTAKASPAAGDLMVVSQNIEGQNLQQFLKGTASAKQFALTFWVKSNVTGTYIVELRDVDNSRIISGSYTISASATWEKKTIIAAADTTGAFDNDNAASLSLIFWLGAGSSFTSGTLNTTSWASSTSANRAVGQTNLAAATNNYWQITGVQLEAGSVATPFEFEDYGTTLAKCSRYYQVMGVCGIAVSTGGLCLTTNMLTPLRAAPSAGYSGTIRDSTDGSTVSWTSGPTIFIGLGSGATPTEGRFAQFIYGTTSPSLVVNRLYDAGSTARITLDAEL